MSFTNFRCLRCGNCCRQLLQTVDLTGGRSAVFGVQIQLGEAEFLRAKNVKLLPQMASGRMHEHLLTYQIGENVCPLLRGNLCLIYDDRPVSCRAYPIQDFDLPDSRCTFLKGQLAHVDENGGGRFKVPIAFPECIEARREMMKCYSAIKWFKPPFWGFDLRSRSWMSIDMMDVNFNR